jgi:uncharacterized membrane protein YfcA
MAHAIHVLASLDAPRMLLLMGIYAAAAVFSGLSGFGFSAIGALSLCVVPPQFGVCMLMLLSLATQAMSVRALRHDVLAHNADWRKGFLPYVVGGILGLPVGLEILARAPYRGLVIALGALLVAYAAYGIFKPTSLALSARETSLGGALAVGVIGGVVGGFSAFPGSALVVWNGLKNVPKDRGRALTQPFILFMQAIALALAGFARPTLFDARLLSLFALSLPLAWAGNRVGLRIYRRTSHVNYRVITLSALGVSGLSLLLKAALFS